MIIKKGKQGFIAALSLIVIMTLFAGCTKKSTKEKSTIATNETTVVEKELSKKGLRISHTGKGDVLTDEKGNELSKVYDKISEKDIENDSDFIRFLEDGKWGYLTANGQVCIPAKYTAASMFEHQQSYARVKIDGKWGVIDTDVNVVVPFQYDKIAPIPSIYTLTSAIKNGRAYIISLGTGDECQMIEAGQYSDIGELMLGEFFLVKNKKGKSGLLLANGIALIKPRYKKIDIKQQDEYIYKITTTDFKNNVESWIYESLEKKIYKEWRVK